MGTRSAFRLIGRSALNESPSEKEGKSKRLLHILVYGTAPQ